MTPHDHGPWGAPQPRPARRRSRLALWLAVVALAGAGVWGLSRLFPGRIATATDWAFLVRGVGVFALVSAGIVASGRLKLRDSLRHLAVWIAIAAALVVGYSFRAELGETAQRVESGLVPGLAAPAGAQRMVLSQSADGAYYVNARVNGQPVIFLVDTGSSDIVLSPADARRLGVDVADLNFAGEYETANGVGRGAAYTAASLDVGQIHLSAVPMSINQAPMRASLLGMSFFRRLQAFEFRDGRLYLTWRG